MPLTPQEEKLLSDFVLTIETKLTQINIVNGLHAIGDAALCHCTVSYGLARNLNIEANLEPGGTYYGDMRSFVETERSRRK